MAGAMIVVRAMRSVALGTSMATVPVVRACTMLSRMTMRSMLAPAPLKAMLERMQRSMTSFSTKPATTNATAGKVPPSASCPPGSIGVDFNPANLILNGHSPREAVRALAPHILHVHAIDATRDLALGRGIEVALGQGSAELPEILGVLEEHQYRGYITVSRKDSDQPLSDIRQGIEFLRNL